MAAEVAVHPQSWLHRYCGGVERSAMSGSSLDSSRTREPARRVLTAESLAVVLG